MCTYLLAFDFTPELYVLATCKVKEYVYRNVIQHLNNMTCDVE